MATKDKTTLEDAVSSDNIFGLLKMKTEERQKAQEIENQRIKASADDMRLIKDREAKLKDAYATKDGVQRSEKLQEISKIDAISPENTKFKGEVTNLAESLTKDLTEFGIFIGDIKNYKGLEKAVSYLPLGLGTKMADAFRLKRVLSADLTVNLETIIDYAAFISKKLGDATIDNMNCAGAIDGSVKEAARKLVDNQPKYENWRSKKEALQREIDATKDLQDKANETDFPKYAAKLAELDKEKQEAEINETHYFGIVETSKQAIPVLKTNLKAYMDTVKALEDMRTRLDNKIADVTEIYRSAETMIKTALKVKAASQIDKGVNYATTRITETVLDNQIAIDDERMNRAERQLIEPEKLNQIRELQKTMNEKIYAREAELKANYAKTPAEK